MNGKPVVIGLLAACAALAGVSLYVRATVRPVERAVQTVDSPDRRYKAVRLSLWSDGREPFCYHSVAILPASLPDRFAESDKMYQVYFAPCALPHDPAQAPAIAWTAPDAVRIAYTPPPGGFADRRLRRRLIDASQGVRIGYVERQ